MFRFIARFFRLSTPKRTAVSPAGSWVEAERELRRRLQSQSPELFHDVTLALFECDPIGINFESNDDEYDPEAGTIIPRLPDCESVDDVRTVIHEEFTRWFSDTAGTVERYTACADAVWEIWLQHRSASDG